MHTDHHERSTSCTRYQPAPPEQSSNSEQCSPTAAAMAHVGVAAYRALYACYIEPDGHRGRFRSVRHLALGLRLSELADLLDPVELEDRIRLGERAAVVASRMLNDLVETIDSRILAGVPPD